MSRPRSRSALFPGLLLMSALAAGCTATPDSAADRFEQANTGVAGRAAVNDAPLYLARARPFEQAGRRHAVNDAPLYLAWARPFEDAG